MEQESSFNIKDIYATLSKDAQTLLKGMTTLSHEAGGRKDTILALQFIDANQLDKNIQILKDQGLMQQGRIVRIRTGNFRDVNEFVIDEEAGERYRLPKEIRTAVAKEILHMSEGEIQQLLDPKSMWK